MTPPNERDTAKAREIFLAMGGCDGERCGSRECAEDRATQTARIAAALQQAREESRREALEEAAKALDVPDTRECEPGAPCDWSGNCDRHNVAAVYARNSARKIRSLAARTETKP